MSNTRQKTVPVTVITGFLGAGKSSMINRLLKEVPGIRFGLVVNEFGEAQLESQILETRKEPIFELPSGCLCCVAPSDLKQALDQLVTRDSKLNHIVVEASGLTSPGPLLQTLTQDVQDQKAIAFRLNTVLTVIDASTFLEREKDFPLVKKQLAFADAVLLTKTDLVENGRVDLTKSRLSELRPKIKVFDCSRHLPWSILLDQHETSQDLGSETEGTQETPGRRFFSSGKHHDAQILEFESTHPLDPYLLGKVFQDLDPGILRAKGYVHINDPSGARWKYLVQFSGTQKQLYSRPWAKSEPFKSFLVFLGKTFDAERLRSELLLCERPKEATS